MKTLICIPVFNGAKYIKKTIESCLKQNTKVQVWIFDNRSTDSTCKIVNTFRSKHNNIKLFINEKNLGRAGNWNRCLDKFMKSKFKYIKFLFPGDEILPECIQKVEKVFNKYKNLGAIFFPYKFIRENGASSVYKRYNKDRLFSAKENTKIALSEGSQLGAIVCNVYSRSAIRNHRFNISHINKHDFDIKVLENHSLYYLNQCLASFLKVAHNSFDNHLTPWGYFEFAYVITKEHNRIKNKKK